MTNQILPRFSFFIFQIDVNLYSLLLINRVNDKNRMYYLNSSVNYGDVDFFDRKTSEEFSYWWKINQFKQRRSIVLC